MPAEYKNIDITGPISIEHRPEIWGEDFWCILIMGPTGAGKSTFIESLAGPNSSISKISSNQLDGFTQQITAYELHGVTRKLGSGPLFLFDTPGFADAKVSEMDIVLMIQEYMESQEIKFFNRILYLSPITAIRLPGSQRQVMKTFSALTGIVDTADQITVVTTMWDGVYGERGLSRAEATYTELRDSVWKDAIRRGTQITKFHNTRDSALHVMDGILADANSADKFFPLEEKAQGGDTPLRDLPFGINLYHDLIARIQAFQLQKEVLQLELVDPSMAEDDETRTIFQSQLTEAHDLEEYKMITANQPLSIERCERVSVTEPSWRVLVMGPTGAGKSTFIEALESQPSLQISSNKLEGFTQTVTTYRVRNLSSDRVPIYIVDSPGFNDVKISEMGIVSMLKAWIQDNGLNIQNFSFRIDRLKPYKTRSATDYDFNIAGYGFRDAGILDQLGFNIQLAADAKVMAAFDYVNLIVCTVSDNYLDHGICDTPPTYSSWSMSVSTGCIGRIIFPDALKLQGISVVAINDPFIDLEYMVYMFKYNSVHGRFKGTIEAKDGKPVTAFAERDPAAIPWGTTSADYIVKATSPKNCTQGPVLATSSAEVQAAMASSSGGRRHDLGPVLQPSRVSQWTGINTAQNITVVTTMWDSLYGESAIRRAESTFNQLQEKVSKDFITSGDHIVKFDNTQSSALSILDDSLSRGVRDYFRIEKMVNDSQELRETPFAINLYDDLQFRIQSLRLQKANIELELSEEPANPGIPTLMTSVLTQELRSVGDDLEKFERELFELGLVDPSLCTPSLHKSSPMALSNESELAPSYSNMAPLDSELVYSNSKQPIQTSSDIASFPSLGSQEFKSSAVAPPSRSSRVELQGKPSSQLTKLKFANIVTRSRVVVKECLGLSVEDSWRVLIMGPTGAGKSTFIEALAGSDQSDFRISSNQLDGFTQKVANYELVGCKHKEDDGQVYVIDTPGFADAKLSELDIVSMIHRHMKEDDITFFHRILYLTPITSVRMPGSHRQVIKTFKALTGNQTEDQITIVTTMWDTLHSEKSRQRAEATYKQLKNEFWKDSIDNGSKLAKFYNTQESALRIIDNALVKTKTATYFALESVIQAEVEENSPIRFQDMPFGINIHTDLVQRIQALRMMRDYLELELRSSSPSDKAIRTVIESQLSETKEILTRFEQQLKELGYSLPQFTVPEAPAPAIAGTQAPEAPSIPMNPEPVNAPSLTTKAVNLNKPPEQQSSTLAIGRQSRLKRWMRVVNAWQAKLFHYRRRNP
ncbi:hypothetical protein CVT24_008997 [Panaeolus cyanescens]|uniref:Glyceraldehyde 3-phosphate dehydrogenase NAD(P) binding domain-containing protein n=1 Tax=Panaeolus cyanescens TaxID=181874 RepID=A0A409YAQ5_9AGAR|nr:hypothetical protein CVT24_008997 [Panaeolus cyanescens]